MNTITQGGRSICLHIGVLIVFCAGSVLSVTAQLKSNKTVKGGQSTTAPPSGQQRVVLSEFDDSIMQIAERVSPAVVQVVVSGFGLATEQKGGTSVVERQGAIASGVIVDSNGYIITNAHVIEGANHIHVVLTRLTSELVPFKTSLRRRQRTLEATLVGTDKLTDLALLKVEASGLPSIPLDADFSVRIGQIVLAVGSPEGLENTITMGIVSSVARQT